MSRQKNRWARNLANKNETYYVRKELDLHIEVLQPKNHDEEKTTLWLQQKINCFKEDIGESGGLVRVYHAI